MTRIKLSFLIFLAVTGILITAAFLFRPFLDADFFWHLKTGEWIWQNRSLMTSDPFTLPPLPEQTPRSQFILTSYWLSQLLLYIFYAIAGLPGILIYRWAIAGIMLYGISKWTSLNNWYVIATTATFWILTVDSFFIERPHFLSFTFLGGLLIVIFKFLEKPDKYSLSQLAIPLSTIMILWGNMHGGFLVGQTILILIILTEGAKFSFPHIFQPVSSSSYKKLAVASIIAIFAALLNPNPINSISMFFTVGNTNNFLYTTNFEYASIIKFITLNHNRVAMLFIASMVLTTVTFIFSKQRTNITWIALLLMTTYMGIKHVRYVPFFFVAATLCTSKIFSTESSRMAIKFMTVIFCCITICYCIKDEPYNLNMVARYGLISAKEYPVQAADYVEQNKLQGNIFNDFNWGGYLIWRFGESRKVFCDGRQLFPSRYWEYLTATSVGKEYQGWKSTIQKYDIQTVILPFFGKNGETIDLTRVLSEDKDWVLVFAKNNAAVFRRKTPQNIVAR